MYSSIRQRFHKVRVPTMNALVGLWSSRASQRKGANRKYHKELIASDLIQEGVDIVYCSFPIVVCPVDTCVSPGGYLELIWDGADVTCRALGYFPFTMSCQWSGGVTTWPSSHRIEGREVILCPVPKMDFDNDSIISVDIVITPSALINSGVEINSRRVSTSFTYAVYDIDGEISRSRILLRYFQDSVGSNVRDEKRISLCGCSALDSSNDTIYSCNECKVCSKNNKSVDSVKDCNGDCFGSAYIDSCEICSGGQTIRSAIENCDAHMSPFRQMTFNLFAQSILLLLMMCFLSLIFGTIIWLCRFISAVAFPARLQRFDHFVMSQLPFRAYEGLSPAEITDIGELRYGEENDVRNPMTETPVTEVTQSNISVNDSPQAKLVSTNSPPRVDGSEEGDPQASSGQADVECPICLQEFQQGCACRRLPQPCGHLFHRDCIDTWFRSSAECPLCKRNVRLILLGGTGTSMFLRDESNGSTVARGNHVSGLQLRRFPLELQMATIAMPRSDRDAIFSIRSDNRVDREIALPGNVT